MKETREAYKKTEYEIIKHNDTTFKLKQLEIK